MRRVDAAHIALMCAAVGLAYVVPFELLLASYVLLGPAHYLTEISWLHERKYFLPHPAIAAVLAVLALGSAVVAGEFWFGIVVWAALLMVALAVAQTAGARLAIGLVAAVLTVLLVGRQSVFLTIAALVPTLVHVSLFTLVFMIVGAHKSGLKAHWFLVALYLSGIGLIVAIPPSAATAIPEFADVAHEYFGDVAPALGEVLGLPNLELDGRMTGLLAFLYSYHYLNWFIKAEVIRWNRMSRLRLLLIALASLGLSALYFHDYALGFTLLLALSNLHVFLEFPLNGVSLRQLGGICAQTVAARVPRLGRARPG